MYVPILFFFLAAAFGKNQICPTDVCEALKLTNKLLLEENREEHSQLMKIERRLRSLEQPGKKKTEINKVIIVKINETFSSLEYR